MLLNFLDFLLQLPRECADANDAQIKILNIVGAGLLRFSSLSFKTGAKKVFSKRDDENVWSKKEVKKARLNGMVRNC